MKVRVYASAGAVAVCMGSGVHAQETPQGQNNDALTEIVVTAQRREERLQDVPISTTITTGADLERTNITGLQDLATRLPNVKIAEGTVDSINIRGVGSGQNAGFEQAVGTFVDGVYRGRARAARAALFDVDRVEVLKGPQTTFFGNNAVAGALNITTRKPVNEFSYNASALYGWDLGEYALEGGVTTPVNDRLSLRFAGRAYGLDGYVDNRTLNRDEPRSRNWIGRASLLWQPTDYWRADLRIDRAHSRREGDGGQILKCPPDAQYAGGVPQGLCAAQLGVTGGVAERDVDDSSFSSVDTYDDYDLTEVAATNRFTLGEHTLTSTTSYFRHSDDLAPTIGPFAFPGVGGTSSAVAASFSEDYHQFAQELRFESPGGETFDYMFGAYYAKGKLDQPSFFGFFFAPFGLFAGPPFTPDTPVAAKISFAQEDETLSGFAAGTWHIAQAFKVNAGLRYSVVKKTAHSVSRFGSGTAPINADTFVEGPPSVNANLAPFFGTLSDFTDTDRKDSELMPSLGVQYDFTDDVMAYASWVTGFKAGGFGVGFQRDTFQPETVDSYEVGLKASLLERRLFVGLASFVGKYDNLQETTNFSQPSGIPIAIITNVAAAKSKGVELSLNWKATSHVVFNADVAYLDATYEDYPNAPCTVLQGNTVPNCTQDLSGGRRAFAPEYSGNIGARVTVPLGASFEARIDPSVYFTSEYFQIATSDPLLRQAGYTKYDLRLALAPVSGPWEVALVGKNLGDKLTASYRNTPPGAFGTIYGLPDPARSIAVQFTLSP